MKVKINHKFIFECVFVSILILILIIPHPSVATNASAEVPRGGMPVLARSFQTNSSYELGELTTNGTVLFATGYTIPKVLMYTLSGKYLGSFGSAGGGTGQFNYPSGIVYVGGYLYVGDQLAGRIEKFTTNGVFVSQFGTAGTANGQFEGVYALATDGTYIYAVDQGNYRIQVFDLQGNFIRTFGSYGSAANQYEYMGDIAFKNGKIYSVDYLQNQVKVWDTSGNFLYEFGNNTGLASSYLNSTFSIAVSNNFVYVGTSWLTDNYIFTFDLNGNFQSEYDGNGYGPGTFKMTGGFLMYNSVLYEVDMFGHQINEFVFLDPPQDLHVSAGFDSISLAWQKPALAQYFYVQSYQIYRSTDGVNYNLYATTTTEFFKDTQVNPGSTYYYKITSVDLYPQIGISDYSSVVKITVPNITSNTNGGFLPFNTTFMIFGIATIAIIIRKNRRK